MNTDQEILEDLNSKDLFADENVEASLCLSEEPCDASSEKKTDGAKEESSSPHFDAFFAQFTQVISVEEKIRLSIEFMRSTLSQSGSPQLRDFWKGRRVCLPLFKENIAPKNRSQLWKDYIELSEEARQLKNILDEQAAFAAEQIELAIQALERDLEHRELLLAQIPEISFLDQSNTLKGKWDVYNSSQRELQLLNALSTRINGLRKELVKTEIRIRTKNKLFARLSSCGDLVFPRRKELIKAVSEEFSKDVTHFIDAHFQEDSADDCPFYVLREEIKALQSIAKFLTLNTHCFTATRLKLSECWDKLKFRERERKKEFSQRKQNFKQNFDLVMEKITVFAENCRQVIALDEANRQMGEILEFMKTLELARDQISALKDEAYKARRIIADLARDEESERVRKGQEVEMQHREKINALKDQVQQLTLHVDTTDIEQLIASQDLLSKEFETLVLSKAERQIIERLFKQLKDVVNEKKERILMNLSEDDLKSLGQLKEMLQERKERRQEIKIQLEGYRKALGGSGFDFEKAMMYRELIETEKSTLDKLNGSIDEIEDKIDEIEG